MNIFTPYSSFSPALKQAAPIMFMGAAYPFIAIILRETGYIWSPPSDSPILRDNANAILITAAVLYGMAPFCWESYGKYILFAGIIGKLSLVYRFFGVSNKNIDKSKWSKSQKNGYSLLSGVIFGDLVWSFVFAYLIYTV